MARRWLRRRPVARTAVPAAEVEIREEPELAAEEYARGPFVAGVFGPGDLRPAPIWMTDLEPGAYQGQRTWR